MSGCCAPGPESKGSGQSAVASMLKQSGMRQPKYASCAAADVIARFENASKERNSNRSEFSSGNGWLATACNLRCVCLWCTFIHLCFQSMFGLYVSRNVMPRTTSKLLISTTRKDYLNLKCPIFICTLVIMPTIGRVEPSASAALGSLTGLYAMWLSLQNSTDTNEWLVPLSNSASQ